MCAKWRDDFDTKLILDRVAESASIKPNGDIGYAAPEFPMDIQPTLISAIAFVEGVPPSEYERVAMEALQEAVRQGNLSPQFVKSALKRAEQKYLRRKETNYILASSISLKVVPKFRRTQINGRKIVLSHALPKHFDRSKIEAKASTFVAGRLPKDYVAVRIHTSGRTQREAVDSALDTLNLVSGIWNFCLARGMMWLPLGTSPRPLAAIELGPIHTLHDPNGNLASDLFWYEPSYVRPAHHFVRANQYGKLRRSEKAIRSHLLKCHDSTLLNEAFRRYSGALGEPRMEVAFLKLWGLLELLTGTQKAEYATTVRRASFIHDDRKFAREQLQHLRVCRNNLVHRDALDAGDRQHANQLKTYVDDMLFFFLKANATQKMNEIRNFLDLPWDINEIDQKIRLLRSARDFRIT